MKLCFFHNNQLCAKNMSYLPDIFLPLISAKKRFEVIDAGFEGNMNVVYGPKKDASNETSNVRMAERGCYEIIV